MTIEQLKVIVIGAGTGGMCLAHGLTRAGITVEVYERDRHRTDGLYGYRVGIDPDGSRALQACLPAELYATFVATCARGPKHFNMLDEHLHELLSLDLRDDSDPVNSEKSVSRMTLRQVLLTGLEDVVKFDKTFTHFEQTPGGKVTAHFADGTSATGDLLVAADGTRSRVRGQYLPHARVQPSGVIAIGGKVALDDRVKALLTPKIFNGISLLFAPGGLSAVLHVMEFKWAADGTVKEGIGGNDAAIVERWPGLLFDNTRDYVNWGVSAPAGRFPADLDSRSGEQLIALTLRMTEGWSPQARELFAGADPGSVTRIVVSTSAPVPQWPTSNVTLLGDAIHTMTPGRGVGANTALRDAALLTRRLTEVRDGRRTLLDAVRDYETRMIGYGFAAVKDSMKQSKPITNRIVLAGLRGGLRLLNHVPAAKRKMTDSLYTYRGADRSED